MTSEKTLDWMEGLARSLVCHAARHAPGELSERLREEWLADMSERPQGFSRLRFAIGCRWATSIITREHGGAAVPAVSAAVAPSDLGGYIQMGPAYSPRRTVTFILVASLHAAVFAGLMLGLTAKFKKPTPPDFQTFVIDKQPPPVEAPTIDKPNLSNPVIDVSPPKVLPIEPEAPVIPDQSKDDAIDTIRREATPPDPPLHAVNRVPGAPGTGFPSTSDYYPDIAIRKGQQGSAAVNVCVDVRGRLTSSPSILQSSGTATLDQAALRLAKAGSGHYQPTKEDGRPVESCYGFLIQFILK